MIAAGIDDHAVMEISAHSDARMLARYTHPTSDRKIAALDSFDAVMDGQDVGRTENHEQDLIGGRREDRTRDLRVANVNAKKR